jgi:hypothetical protein
VCSRLGHCAHLTCSAVLLPPLSVGLQLCTATRLFWVHRVCGPALLRIAKNPQFFGSISLTFDME